MAPDSEIDNVVLYDGDCGFCNQSIALVLKYESKPLLKFCSLQSARGRSILLDFNFPLDYKNSVLFYSNGELYSRSEAAFRITGFMKFPFALIKPLTFLPSFLFDAFYDLVAKHRLRFIRNTNTCLIPTKDNSHRFLS